MSSLKWSFISDKCKIHWNRRDVQFGSSSDISVEIKCALGVSGQFYLLLGDIEKAFTPLRFLGFDIYLHDKGLQYYLAKPSTNFCWFRTILAWSRDGQNWPKWRLFPSQGYWMGWKFCHDWENLNWYNRYPLSKGDNLKKCIYFGPLNQGIYCPTKRFKT